MGGNTRFISSVEHDVSRTSGRSEQVVNIMSYTKKMPGISKHSCIFLFLMKVKLQALPVM